MGRTPLTPIDLKPGVHTIRLDQEGFEPYEEQVPIRRFAEKTVARQPVSSFGLLWVESTPPEAAFEIVDQFGASQVVVAPAVLRLREGTYSIVSLDPDYEPATDEVDVRVGGAETRWSSTRQSGWLELTTNVEYGEFSIFDSITSDEGRPRPTTSEGPAGAQARNLPRGAARHRARRTRVSLRDRIGSRTEAQHLPAVHRPGFGTAVWVRRF